MAEQDAKQLSEINAGLIGHANTHQKIRQLDRIRTDLATQKKASVLDDVSMLLVPVTYVDTARLF